MHILALNVGSSNLKYKLFAMPTEEVLAEGNIENNGGSEMAQAAQDAIAKCLPFGIGAIGHRIVHGGRLFSEPTVITKEVLLSLHGIEQFDPTHNPTEVLVIEVGLRLVPNAPAVAIFDTAFHKTLPRIASDYALPWEMSERMGLRRYGFHGISYQFTSKLLLKCLGREAMGTRLIICHLGSGASICAIRDGQSVDTSMGLTPLEGLVMGTRCGDIDPGLLLYLLRSQKMTPAQLDNLLNQQSGLKGISGRSSDERTLEDATANGDELAERALAMAAYRVRKYIGAYAAAMGGVDAIAFTGGIGEHSPSMRRRICDELGFLGVSLDSGRNESDDTKTPTLLSRDGGAVPVWRIPTDEELQVARETFHALSMGNHK